MYHRTCSVKTTRRVWSAIRISNSHQSAEKNKVNARRWPVAFTSYVAWFPAISSTWFRFQAHASTPDTCDAKSISKNRTRQWPLKFPSLRFPRHLLCKHDSLILRNKERLVCSNEDFRNVESMLDSDAENQTFSVCDCATKKKKEARSFGTDQSLGVVCIYYFFFRSRNLEIERDVKRDRGVGYRNGEGVVQNQTFANFGTTRYKRKKFAGKEETERCCFCKEK